MSFTKAPKIEPMDCFIYINKLTLKLYGKKNSKNRQHNTENQNWKTDIPGLQDLL